MIPRRQKPTPPETIVFNGLRKGEIEGIRELLEQHPKIQDEYQSVGRSIVHAAAESDRADVMDFLLSVIPDIDIDRLDEGGVFTALHDAAGDGLATAVKWLLDHGANPEGIAKGVNCATALCSASRNGHFEVVKMLLEHGANPNAYYDLNIGKTVPKRCNPLMFAVAGKHAEMEALLRKYGAEEIEPVPNSSGPPKELHEEVTEYLLQYLGTPYENALVEVVPTSLPPTNIVIYPQTETNNSLALVTSGTSECAIPVPEGKEQCMFAELVFHLSPDWPIRDKEPIAPEHYWPVKWLKRLVSYPFENNTYYDYFTVLTLEELGIEPDDSGLAAVIVVYDEDLKYLEAQDRAVVFYFVNPLYEEEYQMYKKHGIEKLRQAFIDNGIEPVYHKGRKNVAI